MGVLLPFRAYRYASPTIGPLDRLVSQPYDKITPSMREDYLRRHPDNIVRVIKNDDYQAAGEYVRRWIGEGVLVQDPEPAFYPYEQVFTFEGQQLSRLGVIGLISVEESQGAVKGHENVLREPLEDRLRLIRETESNEGLIFTLYPDRAQLLEQRLRGFTDACAPIAEVRDEYSVIHRLWKVTDREFQKTIATFLADRPMYIADGHHRYQTSVLYCRKCRERGWKVTAVESFDKRLIALFSLDSPAMKILPTHRAIRNLASFSIESMLERLAAWFDVRRAADSEELTEEIKRGEHRIGLAAGSPPVFCVLQLKERALDDTTFLPGIQGPARELDVNLLHKGILEPVLGIGKEALASEQYVTYIRASAELIDGVTQGTYQLGFLLRPTSLEQVRQVSEAGEKMPQKSTDFFPKLLTGLVIMRMEIGKGQNT